MRNWGTLSVRLFGVAAGTGVVVVVLTAVSRHESSVVHLLYLATGAIALAGVAAGVLGLRRRAERGRAAIGAGLNAVYVAGFLWMLLTRSVPV